MKKYALGVDVGGSHISCALVDIESGVMVDGSYFQSGVDNQADVDSVLKSWVRVLSRAIVGIEKDKLAGIGFGMPGPFEYATGIARFEKVAKYESLNGIDVGLKLRDLLKLEADIPLRFMNDASAFAVGEDWQGSASAANKSVSITLGTGFGSAFINKGIPVVESTDVPEFGCFWHLPYQQGIADDSFSTRWFVKRYKEEVGIDVSGVLPIAKAAAMNPNVAAIFTEYGINMGEFIGPWLKVFNANVLVIGGNVTGAYNLFGPAFETALKNLGVKTIIKLSKLKENAAIIGSARMLDEQYWIKIKPILPKM